MNIEQANRHSKTLRQSGGNDRRIRQPNDFHIRGRVAESLRCHAGLSHDALGPEPYVSNGLHPFFENLLPEGWLLEVASKTLKISKDDAFGLLLATCADCVGDVEIEPMPTEEN